MKLLLAVSLLYVSSSVLAQKPALDTSAFRKWVSVAGAAISNDGEYVSYEIYNKPLENHTLIIRAIHGDWKREVIGAFDKKITNDSRIIIFRTGADSLWFMTLGTDKYFCIPHISEYSLHDNGKGDCAVYKVKEKADDLVLLSLPGEKYLHFGSVASYLFSANGKYLLLEKKMDGDGNKGFELSIVDLSSDKVEKVWTDFEGGRKVRSYAFSNDGRLMSFVVENKARDESELWFYKTGMDSAIKLLDNGNLDNKIGLQLASQAPEFSKDSNEVYFGLTISNKLEPSSDAAHVEVWNYRDKSLQSLHGNEARQIPIYLAVINVVEKRVIQLEKFRERIVTRADHFVLVKNDEGQFSSFESKWNSAAQSSYYLISTIDGSRKFLKSAIKNPDEELAISPGGKWILYYDYGQKNYFSYEIRTGITRNITKRISGNWIDEENDRPDYKLTWQPWRKTWLRGDESVLIYDNYDIWKIDPSGVQPPMNLTNGYGKHHHIKFKLAEEGLRIQDFSTMEKPILVLTAFDEINKNNGFYLKELGKAEDPSFGTMGPFVFGEWSGYQTYNSPPLKARDTNAYIVVRMSATQSPNYFVTSDFLHFNALTDIQPQKDYNWLTTDLIRWKKLDGTSNFGILYKPENFDSTKKYPVIFDFYEKRSSELNLYIRPGPSESRINIPWYVSNGYLVCTPDIHYKEGEPGKSAYFAVVSAAHYLSKMPWVDSNKMGIQGHSFGGYETNYIVTHCAFFAAACSASGMSDLISWYGSILRGGYPKFWAEEGQGRLGGTLWEMPNSYIANSPIFMAHKVTTPLLMMANEHDKTVPFAQSVEFFTALRRLGRRVWLLQYDEGAHSVSPGKDALDYSIRMKQFFDHYLKGIRPPKWMTGEFSPAPKSFSEGLDLDNNVSTPGAGLNIEASKIVR